MHHELSRKIALLKALLRSPKILVLKDPPWMVGKKSITEILEEQRIECSVVGITSNLMGCKGAQRIVYLDKLRVVEQGDVATLTEDPLSFAGELLRKADLETLGVWQAEEEIHVGGVLQERIFRNLMGAILDYSLGMPPDEI